MIKFIGTLFAYLASKGVSMPKQDFLKDITIFNELASQTSHKILNRSQNGDDISADIFQKNLNAIFMQDQPLAQRLFTLKGQGDFEIFMGNDPLDLNIIDKSSMSYIYDNPLKQTQDLLKEFESKYKRYPFLYFYGFGNGVFYKALLGNEVREKVVVVEPRVEIIYIVLHLLDLSKEISSGRLILFCSEFISYSQLYYLVSNERVSLFAKLYDLHIHTPFYDAYSEDYSKINKDFTRAIAQTAVNNGNNIDDVLMGVRQHTQNLPAMLQGYRFYDIFKARVKKNDTAIIVSTGPSLDKQLDTLKEYAPYASIISVDASYPIIAKRGIKPDYVTSIERVVATSSFFEKSYPKVDKDTIFIVASVTHPKTAKNLSNRRLALVMRPQANELISGLDAYGYLGLGHSTANQAFQLAMMLGHKNIVLIGQDLAFGPDGASHAKGHAFIQEVEDIYTTAYGGNGKVRTTYVWEKFKNRFETDIESCKQKNISVYNCTEGGARIEGSIEAGFKQTMQKLKGEIKNMPKVKLPSRRQMDLAMLRGYKFIQKKTRAIRYIKDKIEAGFLELAPKIDEVIALYRSGDFDELKLLKRLISITNKIDKLKAATASIRHTKYTSNIISISIFYQEMELAKTALAPSETNKEKIQKLIEWVEIHKYWLFSVAGGLDADLNTTTTALQGLIKSLKERGLWRD